MSKTVVSYAWASDHLPTWLVNLAWPQWCPRCDRPVSRWHFRRCRHYAIVLDQATAKLPAAWRCDLCGLPHRIATCADRLPPKA